jgi:hypothetical protein
VHVSIRSVYIVVDRGEQICPLLSLSLLPLSPPLKQRGGATSTQLYCVCVCARARALLSQLQGRAAAESGIWIKAYESGPLRGLRSGELGVIASLWIRLEPLGESMETRISDLSRLSECNQPKRMLLNGSRGLNRMDKKDAIVSLPIE